MCYMKVRQSLCHIWIWSFSYHILNFPSSVFCSWVSWVVRRMNFYLIRTLFLPEYVTVWERATAVHACEPLEKPNILRGCLCNHHEIDRVVFWWRPSMLPWCHGRFGHCGFYFGFYRNPGKKEAGLTSHVSVFCLVFQEVVFK